jgi:RNA polymerase sigma-70 factor (ECF subfamily)
VIKGVYRNELYFMMKWPSHYKKCTDETLMSLITAGKAAALKELYIRYSNKLLFYFYRMLGGNEEKAQDFLQDVFLKILEKPGQFNPGLKFSTWIFSIASNLCKNEYRRLKVREIVENESDMDRHPHNDQDNESKIDHHILEMAIQKKLMQLDSDQRSTFLLRFQENYSIDEISKIMDCAPGTVKSRLFYTSRKLEMSLKELNPNQLGE